MSLQTLGLSGLPSSPRPSRRCPRPSAFLFQSGVPSFPSSPRLADSPEARIRRINSTYIPQRLGVPPSLDRGRNLLDRSPLRCLGRRERTVDRSLTRVVAR